MCDCCNRLIRTFVAIINGIIIVAAAAGGIAIYMSWQKIAWFQLLKTELPAQFILGVAIVAVLSALIGFFALCCQKGGGGKFCRIAYLTIIILVIILEVVCGVVAYFYGDKLIKGIGENWGDESAKETVKLVEKEFKCCDFQVVENQTQIIEGCGFNTTETNIPYCYDKILDDVKANLKWIFVVGIILAALELVLLISAIYLRCTVQQKDGELEGIAKF